MRFTTTTGTRNPTAVARVRRRRGASLRAAVWGAAGGAAFVGILVAGRYAALADTGGPSGTPGGKSVDSIGFAGTLRQDGKGMPAGTALTFAFKRQKNGAVGDCPPIEVKVDPDAETGAFSMAIPLNACAAALFDGGDVFFDVTAGGTLVASGQQALAVPYAKYADRVGTPDCPAGYARVADPNFVICSRGPAGQEDEVVRVGSGASAFWVDRYEATLWTDAAGTKGSEEGVPYGFTENDYPPTFPRNGQVTQMANLLYAVSRKGVPPSRGVNWLQSSLACAASGKRLPNGAEWLLAATGTPDPATDSTGDQGTCLTKSVNDLPRNTGAEKADVNCASLWGAQDMVGNVREWTADSYASVTMPMQMETDEKWPASFGNDGTSHITSMAFNGPPDGSVTGIPAVALRGGGWAYGPAAGVFEVSLNYSAGGWNHDAGFRCIIH